MLLLKESKGKTFIRDELARRSSRSQMFLKIGVFKNFTIFTGTQLCWSLFLIKLLGFRPATLFKRDSQTGVFLCAQCENFKYTFFYRTPLVAAFFIISYLSQRKLSCTLVVQEFVTDLFNPFFTNSLTTLVCKSDKMH